MRAITAAALLAASIAQPAAALTFSFATVSGDSLSASQAAAFSTAAGAWSAVLRDPFTVSLQIGFSASLGAGVLGATSPTYISRPASSVVSQLAADAKDADDIRAVASLTALPPPGSLLLTTAEAKALGYAAPGVDAVIQFSSGFTFSTSRQSDGSTAAGTFDLIGIAEHEIGHALGFDSSFDLGSSSMTVLDLFRFNAAGARSTTAANSYFSLDDGATALAAFSPGPGDAYQSSHWQQGTVSNGAAALMDPAVSPGVTQNITPLDLEALDVIGYDAGIPVAEPASAMLLAASVAGVLVRRRRPAPRYAAAR